MQLSERALQLKHAEYATVAHISDLHFVRGEHWQAGESDAGKWRGLISAIKDIEADVIVVTGDLVNSPDKKAYSQVRRYLETLCYECEINPELGLFVVPGNHDARFSGLFTFGRSGIKVFRETFSKFMLPSLSRLQAKGRTDISLGLFCLDSNLKSALLAGGEVDAEHLVSCGEFLSDNRVQAAYSIVLMHHHPAPVHASEASQERYLEPTMILNNAGAVMDTFLRHGANLVLHGHKHWDGMTQVMSPSVDEHVVCVVAAGSVGRATGARVRFNEIRIRRSHVATVIVHEAIMGFEYKARAGIELGKYEVTRVHRRDRLYRRMRDTLPWAADRIEHRVRIEFNGDIELFRAYRGLTPIVDGSSFLPITIRSSVAAAPPSSPEVIKPIQGPITFTYSSREKSENLAEFGFEVRGQAQTNISIGDLEFQSRLPGPFYHVTEEKTAAMIREAAQSRPPQVVDNGAMAIEWWDFNHKDVFADQLVRVLTFPLEFERVGLHIQVRVIALDHTKVTEERFDSTADFVDSDESKLAQNGLIQTGPRQYTLVVHNPLPGYVYRLEWALASQAKFSETLYEKQSPELKAKCGSVRSDLLLGDPTMERVLTLALQDIASSCNSHIRSSENNLTFSAGFFVAVPEDFSLICVAATPELRHAVRSWTEYYRNGYVGQSAAQRSIIEHWPRAGVNWKRYVPSLYNRHARFVLCLPVFEPSYTPDNNKLSPLFGIFLLSASDEPDAAFANELQSLKIRVPTGLAKLLFDET